ncbi:hypothetical protein Bca52824_021263 [Brassica carinata]|uniref:Uncharacterized protein n=1 Tax=Brassica carinata TaxID=52824 RepID=A0A8X7VV08_BRACI|nr:hypothetical protein Bca52824_021263 [Brassica carinata]
MARDTISAIGDVLSDVFGIYEPTIFKVPGGWAYEAKALRSTNYVQLGDQSIRIPNCWPLYTLSTISVKFVPCKVSW